MKLTTTILVFLLLAPFKAYSIEDNETLAEVFRLDQEMRTEENFKNWPLYQPLEERSFRLSVFRLLVENKIRTANDYYRAAIILIHTHDYGHENFILAAKLAEKAIEMKHPKGKFALDAAVSKYSLHKQLPSDDWTLYAVDDKLITKQQLEINMSNPINE